MIDARAIRSGWAEAPRMLRAQVGPGFLLAPPIVLLLVFATVHALFDVDATRAAGLVIALLIVSVWAPRVAWLSVADEVGQGTWPLQRSSAGSPLAFAAAKVAASAALWGWPFALAVAGHVWGVFGDRGVMRGAGHDVTAVAAHLAAFWGFVALAGVAGASVSLAVALGAAMRGRTGRAMGFLGHLTALLVLVPLLTGALFLWLDDSSHALDFATAAEPVRWWGVTTTLECLALASVAGAAAMAVASCGALAARAFSRPVTPLAAAAAVAVAVAWTAGLLSDADMRFGELTPQMLAHVDAESLRAVVRVGLVFAAATALVCLAFVWVFLCPFDAVSLRRFAADPLSRARLGDCPRGVVVPLLGLLALCAIAWEDLAVLGAGVCRAVGEAPYYLPNVVDVCDLVPAAGLQAFALSVPAFLLRDLGFVWAVRMCAPRVGDVALAIYLMMFAGVVPMLLDTLDLPGWALAPFSVPPLEATPATWLWWAAPAGLGAALWGAALLGWRAHYRTVR